jgi:hypothetical protein
MKKLCLLLFLVLMGPWIITFHITAQDYRDNDEFKYDALTQGFWVGFSYSFGL